MIKIKTFTLFEKCVPKFLKYGAAAISFDLSILFFPFNIPSSNINNVKYVWTVFFDICFPLL